MPDAVIVSTARSPIGVRDAATITASGTAASSSGDGSTSFNTQSGRSGISTPGDRWRRTARPTARVP